MNKRFLCTQAKNTLKNPNLNPNWKIKQVKKSNFNESLEEIKTQINNSEFIAISLQKSGSYSLPWQKVCNFDTIHTSYLKSKRSSEHFQVFQLAICPFTLDESRVTAFPFNFHLFPREELKTGLPCYSFACQTSSMTSMAQLGFDFNACIYDGISYLSRAQEAAMKPLSGTPVRRAHAVESSTRAATVADTIFIERIKSRVKNWKNACKEARADHADPLVNALRKVVVGDHQSRPSMDVDVCSDRQVQLVLEVLKQFSDDTIPLIIPTKNGSTTQGVRVVLTTSKEDKNRYEKELEAQEEEQSKRVRGFREVIDLISSSKKPIIAHNSLNELAFIHTKFIGPLPPSFEEFKGSLGSYFPLVVDLGHLMKEINSKEHTDNISAASSSLKSQYSTPVTVDLPLEGTEDEMHEGEIHGRNVVTLSRKFAKLYSVLKHNQLNVSDNSLALEKYTNVFSPCSTPLENSGDVDKVSSGRRKVSCDDVIFLWGFRNGLSAGALKSLLSGSHIAFSEDFDVRLVDKSCAVIATHQPGLTKAFLESMSSGGTGDDGLKKLISEGLKAANYETYKRVFDFSMWDYDLADCLDQVVMLDDHLPVDSQKSRSPYEIWWDDDTALES